MLASCLWLIEVLLLISIANGKEISCSRGINDNHALVLNSTNLCLTNEDTLFVDGFFVNCNPQLDSYSNYAMAAINAFCNNDGVVIQGGIPKIQISCNNHNIVFEATGTPCLTTEYGVFIDNVNFLCVAADDTYLFALTNVINAVCGGTSTKTFKV